MGTVVRQAIPSTQCLVRQEYPTRLAGIIYVHRISDERLSGISARNFKMFRELCGGPSLKNVILVTNMWGEVSKDVGEARERELTTNLFKPVLDKGARLARHHNAAQSAHDIIRCIIEGQPFESADKGESPPYTTSDEGFEEEFRERTRRQQAEIDALREEMRQALREKDEEMRRSEEESRRLAQEVDKIRMEVEMMVSMHKEEQKRMVSMHEEERERMGATMWQMQKEARAEREELIEYVNSCLRCR